MSVQSEINRISSNVTAALAAIADKGVTVPDGSNSDSLASLIAAIEAGGGNSNFASGSFTPESNATHFEVNHGLGEIPNFYAVWTYDVDGNQTVLTIKRIYLLCPDINVTSGYIGFFVRCGSGSTYETNSTTTNGDNKVTDFFRNISGLVVYESNQGTCTLTMKFGNNTKAYFHAGYTYKYLIGRCDIK